MVNTLSVEDVVDNSLAGGGKFHPVGTEITVQVRDLLRKENLRLEDFDSKCFNDYYNPMQAFLNVLTREPWLNLPESIRRELVAMLNIR